MTRNITLISVIMLLAISSVVNGRVVHKDKDANPPPPPPGKIVK